jgi:hypothetical protein
LLLRDRITPLLRTAPLLQTSRISTQLSTLLSRWESFARKQDGESFPPRFSTLHQRRTSPVDNRKQRRLVRIDISCLGTVGKVSRQKY